MYNVHLFIRYIMCQSREELYRLSNWPGVEGGARQRLMDQLQGTCMYMYSNYDHTRTYMYYQIILI